MSVPDGEIAHVSDTALMVAACRAHETGLEDAFIRDPFAARLAGERGLAILEAWPHGERSRLAIAMRTRFIDELLLEALAAHPISTVLSLGCGLDTRPWRLELPPELRWIEVDFADLLDYKDRVMSGETPRCRRERLAADINDPAGRRALWQAAGSATALMITEGLLLYLPEATVEDLATEAREQCGAAYWISDIMSSAFRPQGAQSVQRVQASDSLNGEQILDVLRNHGWTSSALRSYITDAGFARERMSRMMGGAALPPTPDATDDPTGVHLFEAG